MDLISVASNPLIKQHVIYCGRHAFLNNPSLWKTRKVISISDNDDEYYQMCELLDDYDSMCIVFADDDKSFTEGDARWMISFINQFKENSNFVVHCFVGASRSAAVAKFIVEYLKLDDSDTANLKYYNEHVYNTLKSLV